MGVSNLRSNGGNTVLKNYAKVSIISPGLINVSFHTSFEQNSSGSIIRMH